jgi:flagellar basal-body rod modification protein FlgD
VEDQFNSFIQLLTAQVQNQDPLAPMDSTQFVDQLATFSALEQQVRTNQLLEGMSGMLSALFLSQSAATLPADRDLPLQT